MWDLLITMLAVEFTPHSQEFVCGSWWYMIQFSCWWSIHSSNYRPASYSQMYIVNGVRLLELIRVGSTVLFFLDVLLVRVYSHELTESGFMSPKFLRIFSTFLIIYMSNWQKIRVGYQLSWTLFFFMSFCSWLKTKIIFKAQPNVLV